MENPLLWQYVGMPLLICLARVCDVSIGTLRIVYVSRGMKGVAAILGFFEVMIWIFSISQVMQNLNNPANAVAFAAGFALGNYSGIWIEEKLSLGILMLRIFTKRDSHILVEKLKANNFGVTTVKAHGGYGPVDLVFTIIKRKKLNSVVKLIKEHHPNAIYTVEEVKFVNSPLQASAKVVHATPISHPGKFPLKKAA